jgi:hypothetical protein
MLPTVETARACRGQALGLVVRLVNQAPTPARTVRTINTIPRSGWLVAKNTTATTSSTTATATRTRGKELRRMRALYARGPRATIAALVTRSLGLYDPSADVIILS